MEKKLLAEVAQVLEPNVLDAAERRSGLLGDETPHELCREHEECTKCLGHWTNSPGEHVDRIKEYTELLSDLQQEILQFPQEHKS